MDVRFCVRQEPSPRGIDCTLRVLQALYWALSRAPQEDPCLLLTKTYMEVGKPPPESRRHAVGYKKAGPPLNRIEQSVTCGKVSGIVQESAAAATTLTSFVHMPLRKHGSRKAIEHWRGFHGSPLGQNPQTANLGGRAQKGRKDARKRG